MKTTEKRKKKRVLCFPALTSKHLNMERDTFHLRREKELSPIPDLKPTCRSAMVQLSAGQNLRACQANIHELSPR